MASTSGRRVVVPLTNKSGGGVIAGDVVIVGTANNDAFTTTTSAAATGTVGIAQETIADNATGRVLLSGYAALVNVTASVTRQNYGTTSTTVKKAVDAGASRVAGTFCQFLTGGTTPDAIVWQPDLGGGSGAPTTSQYIVGTADGGLSAEKVRADLYKNYSPDSYPGSPASENDEFDTGSVDAKWGWSSGTVPSTVNTSQFAGHLYVRLQAAATAAYFRQTYAPGASTAFAIVAKVAWAGKYNDSSTMRVGVAALTNADAPIARFSALSDGAATMVLNNRMYDGSTAFAINAGASDWIYVALARDASDVYTFLWSLDGLIWNVFAGPTSATTVARVGLWIEYGGGTADAHAVVDFFRRFASGALPFAIGS